VNGDYTEGIGGLPAARLIMAGPVPAAKVAAALDARRREREAGAAATVNVTRDGFSRAAPPGHEIEVMEGSAFRTGRGTGISANLRNAWDYPVEAVCRACLGVVARAAIDGEWEHTGRQAGQAPAGEASRVPPGYCKLCRKPFSECRCVPAAGQAPAAAEAPSAAAGPVREASPGASRADGGE